MKKIGIVLVVLAALCFVSVGLADIGIDENYFPDEVFRGIVSEFDTDGDGLLSSTEIKAVKEIDCKYQPISSLRGVEYFSSLEYLDCTRTGLISLDVRQNKKLKTLWCSENGLTSLNVTKNTSLVQLGCASNQLSGLNVSKNKKLNELYCDFNDIKNLDISNCVSLCKLVKSGNRVNSGFGYDYWTDDSSWLYVDSTVTVKAGSVTSRPVNSATTVIAKNGFYQIENDEATLVSPTDITLKKLVIPDTVRVDGVTYKVTAVVPDACENMTELTSVKIGKNVRMLGNKAFLNCVKLKTVTGGEGLVTIGQFAFYGDKSLVEFTIGAKVKKIGKSAFQNCSSLKTIDIKTKQLTADRIGAKAFKGIYSKAKVICPSGMLKLYKRILLQKGMGNQVRFK